MSHVDDSDVARERDAAHAMLIEVSRQLRVARAVIAVIVDQAGWYPELRVKDTIDVDAVINKYKIYLQADLR